MQNTQTAIMRIIERANQYPSNEIKDYILRIIIQEQESILLEKEQIIDAYEYGYWRGNNEDECEPEEYYKNPYCNPNNKYYGK